MMACKSVDRWPRSRWPTNQLRSFERAKRAISGNPVDEGPAKRAKGRMNVSLRLILEHRIANSVVSQSGTYRILALELCVTCLARQNQSTLFSCGRTRMRERTRRPRAIYAMLANIFLLGFAWQHNWCWSRRSRGRRWILLMRRRTRAATWGHPTGAKIACWSSSPWHEWGSSGVEPGCRSSWCAGPHVLHGSESLRLCHGCCLSLS